MSSPLATIDLTGATIGTQATIDFSGFVKFNPAQQNVKAHLRVSNDSGCGLSYKMAASGSGDYIPAGGWHTIELADNDNQMLLTVIYLLPNPPVSIVMPTYYAPGESVPPAPILGNSPVGIGGTVTSTVQAIANDGNAAGTSIMEATVVGDGASAVSLTNDAQFTLGDAAHPGSFKEIMAPIVTAGSVSGNTNTYMWMRGTVKCVLIQFNAMKTNPVNIVLPVAFTAGAHVIMGDGIILQFKLGAGALVTCNNATGFGAFGTSTAGISAFGFGDVLATFDTIVLNGSGASAHSGWARIEGV